MRPDQTRPCFRTCPWKWIRKKI